MCKRAVNHGPVGLQRPAAGRRCLCALPPPAFPLSSCLHGGLAVRRSILPSFALHCPALQCTAVRCIALPRSVLHCSAWR